MLYNTTPLLLTPCTHNHMRTIFCGETKGLSLDDGPRTCLHNQTAPSNIRTHANTIRRPPERVNTRLAHISSCCYSTRFSLHRHVSPHHTRTDRTPKSAAVQDPPNPIHTNTPQTQIVSAARTRIFFRSPIQTVLSGLSVRNDASNPSIFPRAHLLGARSPQGQNPCTLNCNLDEFILVVFDMCK